MGGTHRCLRSRCVSSSGVILVDIDEPILTVVGCGIGVLVRMIFVLTVLFVRALRGNLGAEPEETTILVYAEEIAPPYEAIDEKKAPDAVENNA